MMPIHIFPSNTRLNKNIYVDLLKKVVIPWLNSTYSPVTNFMWIQDMTPVHVAKMAKRILRSNFKVAIKHDEWPSNSPHLNLRDY